MTVPALMALVIVISGISVMNSSVYNLNRRLIAKDLDNFSALIDSEHQILKKAGVDDYPLYISKAKIDFLDNLSSRKMETEGVLFILDSLTDRIIYRSSTESVQPDLQRSQFTYISGELKQKTGHGDLFYLSYFKVPYWDWIVVISMTEKELFGEVYRYIMTVIPLSMIPLISGLFLSFFSLKSVIIRINESLVCLREVEKGNLNIAITTNPVKDEITDIQKAINTMILSLRDLYGNLENIVVERTGELTHLNEYMKNIIDSMPSILIGINRDYTINQWNPEAIRKSLLNETEARGMALKDIISINGEIEERFYKYIRSDEAFGDLHAKLRIGTGQDFYGEINYFPLKEEYREKGIIQIRDITERLQLEELMKHSEKMLSVGGLAAGMAHEINNPLAGMMQSAQNIKRRFDKSLGVNIEVASRCGTDMLALSRYSELRNIPEMIQSILDSGKKAAEIVESMVSFSQKDINSKSLHDVGQILNSALNSLKLESEFNDLLENKCFKIFEEFDSPVPLIPCDEKKLEQAFFNIIRNAFQALSDLDIPEPAVTLRLGIRDGSIRIEIEDNGPGIEESIGKRIFEPFFSTKEVDKGKGLGLSISYFIIRDHHGGNLWLENRDTGGTLFIITLPVKNLPERVP